MMRLKKPYRKGYRVEREVKSLFEQAGFKTLRSPASKGSGDLFVEGLGNVQVKARNKIAVYSWFDGADVLVIKANRKEPLIILPLKRFLKLLKRCKP